MNFVGAVMAASRFKTPIKLCRKIMEQTNHCAMTGEGALKFAQERGFTHLIFDSEELKHVETNTRVANMDFTSILNSFQQQMVFDTVAAVALDSNGHFACATSTGESKKLRKIGKYLNTFCYSTLDFQKFSTIFCLFIRFNFLESKSL